MAKRYNYPSPAARGSQVGPCPNHPGKNVWCKGICKDCYQKQWLETNRKRLRNLMLQKQYGISLEDYQEILSEQNGHCAICKTAACPTGVSLAVDHNHKTGKVRGLLCMQCNQAIGKLKDNPLLFERVSLYLHANNTRTRVGRWVFLNYKEIMETMMVFEIVLLIIIVLQGWGIL